LFLRDGPPESIHAGNASGWMTTTDFLIFMDHFIKYVKPTPSESVLLLLDNHFSHINFQVVKPKKTTSSLLFFSTTHNTQITLDVSVNGPFKTYCANAQDN